MARVLAIVKFLKHMVDVMIQKAIFHIITIIGTPIKYTRVTVIVGILDMIVRFAHALGGTTH